VEKYGAAEWKARVELAAAYRIAAYNGDFIFVFALADG
jgi:hypothetical protein